MIYALNLPKLSDELTANLIAQANAMVTDENIAKWKAKRPWPFTDDQLVASNVVDRLGGYIPEADAIEALIAPLLPFSVNFEFFIMKNIRPGSPAMLPPHLDFKRTIAINYVLQLGGTNVVTDFHSSEGMDLTQKIFDPTLPVAESYAMPLASWHAFDATAIHSAAGIDDLYILIAVALNDSTVTFADLQTQHPELFGATYTAKVSN